MYITLYTKYTVEFEHSPQSDNDVFLKKVIRSLESIGCILKSTKSNTYEFRPTEKSIPLVGVLSDNKFSMRYDSRQDKIIKIIPPLFGEIIKLYLDCTDQVEIYYIGCRTICDHYIRSTTRENKLPEDFPSYTRDIFNRLVSLNGSSLFSNSMKECIAPSFSFGTKNDLGTTITSISCKGAGHNFDFTLSNYSILNVDIDTYTVSRKLTPHKFMEKAFAFNACSIERMEIE